MGQAHLLPARWEWDILESGFGVCRCSQRIWQSYTCLCLRVLFGLVWFGLVFGTGWSLGVINSCLSVRSTSVDVSWFFFLIRAGSQQSLHLKRI